VIVRKTVIPRREKTYSSFPTLATNGDRVYVFFRQGRTSNRQCHGVDGVVKCFEIEKEVLLRALGDDRVTSLFDLGRETTVFGSAGANEIDAIVSRPQENVYTLATRLYNPPQLLKSYISFSDTPCFQERTEVRVKGVRWLVFYGKAFRSPAGYVFPAYGALEGEGFSRPLLLVTDNGESWDVLSWLPSNLEGHIILNESSVVHDGDQYVIFMRRDTPPYGIWYATSFDLQAWSEPQPLLEKAHAPMSLKVGDRLYLTFRDLSDPEVSAVSLLNPLDGGRKTVIDTYHGDLYDGGYTDLLVIDGYLLIVYYLGNEKAEPEIRLAALPLGDYGWACEALGIARTVR